MYANKLILILHWSHLYPSYPYWHVHWYPWRLFLHTPCTHGFGSQSVINRNEMKQNKTVIFRIYRCINNLFCTRCTFRPLMSLCWCSWSNYLKSKMMYKTDELMIQNEQTSIDETVLHKLDILLNLKWFPIFCNIEIW